MLVSKNTQNWLPELFNTMFDAAFMPSTRNTQAPALNVLEDKDTYTVEVAAPGMDKEDFTVSLNEDDNLVIDIEKKTEVTDEKTDNGVRYLQRGFGFAKMHRTLILPEDVDLDKITATANCGILTVTLPKMVQEEVKREARTIAIN
ncbi:MAG: Hsp20/alpha crystallin family protein [Bacteroidales bacterium]|nr:Hsp20/alpha crystallin family protein [Candidatus Sodaliphilus aphodohippi]